MFSLLARRYRLVFVSNHTPLVFHSLAGGVFVFQAALGLLLGRNKNASDLILRGRFYG